MIERTIIHVLSHNVVMAKLSSGNNSIIFGKGVGFKKSPGMPVSKQGITSEFLLQTSEVLEHYEQILHAVDFKIIALTEEAIAMAQQQLQDPFSETIHASLIDHINFAIERNLRGIYITNPFDFEIQHLYRDEYEAAKQAIAFLNRHLETPLPQDEVAFLAMHFHGARNNQRSTDSLNLARLVSTILEEAKAIGLNLDHSFSAIRFIYHLKGLIERVKGGSSIQNPLIDKIRTEYKMAYQKAVQLAKVMEANLTVPMPDDEIGYLTMHVQRLMQRNRME